MKDHGYEQLPTDVDRNPWNEWIDRNDNATHPSTAEFTPRPVQQPDRHLATLEIATQWIVDWLAIPPTGIRIGDRLIRVTQDAIPPDARIVHTTVNQRGSVVLTLEHDSLLLTFGNRPIYQLHPTFSCEYLNPW